MPVRTAVSLTAFILTFALAPLSHAAGARLKLVAKEREPRDGRTPIDNKEAAALRALVEKSPGDRAARLRLVQGLLAARRPTEALEAARAWRDKDAYHLVVARLVGDIHVELGDRDAARRAYSSVVELLPRDPQAHRALATVLKQTGDLEPAAERLASAAALAPEDRRIAFELADVQFRLGRVDEAEQGFRTVAEGRGDEKLRYPARQRLAQIWAARRRASDDKAERAKLAQDIENLGVKGGVENDVKVYLTWDTDRSDVDLWVTTPSGEKVFYSHREGAGGESLFDDVTTGYGPESFTAHSAATGTYVVEVNYFGAGRSTFGEARGEVTVVLHEGRPDEERHVLPYRLFEPKQTVTVAEIEVRR